MRLSVIFELLLIFILLAFAAQAKSIKRKSVEVKDDQKDQDQQDDDNKDETGINKYCQCKERMCNCCRDFNVPLISVNGPGCATLQYVKGDRMAVSLSFGKRVITNRTISGRSPRPICMPLPGGLSKFCGRVYNIAKEDKNFKACLGLELQSNNDIEASVRVACFKFGPDGVQSEPGQQLPLLPLRGDGDNDDDDDDDDDDVDFDLDDDDDEDDADVFGVDDDDDDETESAPAEADNDVASPDYTGFSLLGEDIIGDLFGSYSSSKKKPKINKKKAADVTTTTTTTTTKRPRPTRRTTTRRPSTTRSTTVRSTTVRVTSPRPSRRPSRRPTRRPTRRTTTTLAPTSVFNEQSETGATLVSGTSDTSLENTIPHSTAPLSAELMTSSSTESISSENLEPVLIVTQKPFSRQPSYSSLKPSTNIEDDGIQLSLASITGQLASGPVTTIIPPLKAASTKSESRETVIYEKIPTITQSSIPDTFFQYSSSTGIPNHDPVIQIVESFDDKSEEDKSQSMPMASTETLSFEDKSGEKNYIDAINEHKDKLKDHEKNNDSDGIEDMLGLSSITEAISILSEDSKPKNEAGRNHGEEDYDFLGLEAWSDTLGFSGKRKNNRKHKGRGRQNKMMRGDWVVV